MLCSYLLQHKLDFDIEYLSGHPKGKIDFWVFTSQHKFYFLNNVDIPKRIIMTKFLHFPILTQKVAFTMSLFSMQLFYIYYFVYD